MHQIINEGSAKVKVEKTEKISSEMEVFYNPAMKLNRDIAVLFLDAIPEKNLRVGLPMEATGIRGIRFLKELSDDKVESIEMNDRDMDAAEAMAENIKLSNVSSDKAKKVIIRNTDANIFLLSSRKFHYIDIDPFGTPNPFLDSSMKALRNHGYLAVTATDTAALAGTSKNACIRKYWAIPRRDSCMHETAVRILIRKVQLVGAQYHAALFPLLSYHDLHYYRVYFRCFVSKEQTDKVLSQHGMDGNAGLLWLGDLWDNKLVEEMMKKTSEDKLKKFLNVFLEESKIKTIGFYDIHEICERKKITPIPKFDKIIGKISELEYMASRTHFCLTGIRSDISEKELISVVKKLSK